MTEPTQPVLQVLESRFLAGAQQSVRLRLSDGIFSYSGCGVITNLGDRFREDGLLGANAIIRVLDYSVTCRGYFFCNIQNNYGSLYIFSLLIIFCSK